MSDQPLGPGWWQASDGKYYPPETSPDWSRSGPVAEPPLDASSDPEPSVWAAAPPSGPYPHGPYAYGPVPARQGTNGLAIASLTCSLLGLCTCLSAIAGVVLGHVALSQLARPDNHQEGRGLAIAGLAVGYGVLALSLLWVVFVIAVG